MPARLLLAAALAVATGGAAAHDTWFAPLGASNPNETVFALGTGNRFPVFELAVDRQYLARRGCRSGDGAALPLEPLRYTDTTTLLRAASGERATLTCWLQLDPFEFELPADKIEVYFKEIRPGAAVLAAWAGLRARGLPFIERYTKSARIDGASASPTPTGTAMDVLRQAPTGALAVGSEATFQVLREGRPLADFPVELVNERSPVGLWHRTDAEGRIRARLPLPGRWLLRGTDLRLSASDPTRWESQFITYAFEVAR
ncbi:MAG TPA: DUF4198 domain-containing protein [Burkholderiaceae bacterium]|nr:DUF4198 domain-containing protein [Burkholderiaceae bacterium]